MGAVKAIESSTDPSCSWSASPIQLSPGTGICFNILNQVYRQLSSGRPTGSRRSHRWTQESQMRLLLSVALFTGSLALCPSSRAEDVSSLLHRSTQAFSDAGQAGKGSVMARYLDDDVIFFNEGGDRATKADISQDGPPAPGVNRTITTTDWNCKVYGNVAVTSFVDVVEQGPAAKREQYKYRSVETWLKEKGHWKMIGSETLSVPEDPPAVALDQRTLDEYVGTYQEPSGTGITFTRQGGHLFASINGGSAVEQEAQARDIVFTPGHGTTPKVFQRDTNGKITGVLYLRGSHSLAFKRKTA